MLVPCTYCHGGWERLGLQALVGGVGWMAFVLLHVLPVGVALADIADTATVVKKGKRKAGLALQAAAHGGGGAAGAWELGAGADT